MADSKSSSIYTRTLWRLATTLRHLLNTSTTKEVKLTTTAEDGTNIDNWTFEGLVEVVEEFKSFQAQLVLPVGPAETAAETTEEAIKVEPEFIEEEKRQSPRQASPDSLEGHHDSEEPEPEEAISDIEIPDVEYKDFIKTRLVSSIEPKIEKITIKVPSYEVIKGGFFSSDYSLYQVESE